MDDPFELQTILAFQLFVSQKLNFMFVSCSTYISATEYLEGINKSNQIHFSFIFFAISSGFHFSSKKMEKNRMENAKNKFSINVKVKFYFAVLCWVENWHGKSAGMFEFC